MMREVNQSSLLLPTSSATRWERPDLRDAGHAGYREVELLGGLHHLGARFGGRPCQGGRTRGETVAVETPACLATSSMLAFMAPPGFSKLTV